MPTYTAPTTRASGFLVTASVWNTDIVENIKYFKDAPVFDTAVIIGAATTSGVRLDLESGTLAVREGDDSAYAPVIASVYNLPSGGSINFGSGDVTLTHSTNMLTFGGAASGYIFNDGNVGIGVTPGSVKLDIVGLVDAVRVASNTTNATTKEGKFLTRHYTNSEEDFLLAYGYSTATENGIAFGGGSGSQNAATLLGFYTAANNTTTSGTERLRINSSGHIGIGATARFYFDGVAGTGDTYIEEGSANNLSIYVGGSRYLQMTASQFYVQSSDLLIAPTRKFYLDGGGDTYIAETASNVLRLYAGGVDTIICQSDGLYLGVMPTTATAANMVYNTGTGRIERSTSSIRYKHDIATLNGSDALAAVMAMRPVTYRGRTDADQRRHVGFIAEEMQQWAPLLCTYDEGGESGTPNYVTYDRVTAYLVAVVQRQQTEINALKARIH